MRAKNPYARPCPVQDVGTSKPQIIINCSGFRCIYEAIESKPPLNRSDCRFCFSKSFFVVFDTLIELSKLRNLYAGLLKKMFFTISSPLKWVSSSSLMFTSQPTAHAKCSTLERAGMFSIPRGVSEMSWSYSA